MSGERKPLCLVVDKMHDSIMSMAEEAGLSLDYQPEIDRKRLLAVIGKYDVLIIRSNTAVDAELISAARSLKIIARAGAGVDQIDMEEVERRNITVVNAPEGNRDAVGEHAIGMLLTLFAKICNGNTQIRNKVWDREDNRGVELLGKTVGIIGYGNMGKAFAKKLSGFECEVIAYDRYLSSFSDNFVKEVALEGLFSNADIISLHIPLTTETRGMIDETFINRFNRPFYFINTARGEIMDLKAILSGLEEGKLLGACLDVLPNERLDVLKNDEKDVFDKLIMRNDVVLTPHIAGWTHESYRKINQTVVRKIASALFLC